MSKAFATSQSIERWKAKARAWAPELADLPADPEHLLPQAVVARASAEPRVAVDLVSEVDPAQAPQELPQLPAKAPADLVFQVVGAVADSQRKFST